MLTKNEKIEDFKEVTEAEKTALEKADAAWVEPPQSFVDLWDKSCVVFSGSNLQYKSMGRYNAESGFFELNSLTNITFQQALNIYGAYVGEKPLNLCRTNLPIKASQNVHYVMMNTTNIEAFYGNPLNYTTFDYVQNSNVREYRYIKLASFINFQFQGHTKLRTIENILITAKGTMNMSQCELLSLDTMKVLVSANPTGNTITVHPDVYAKLTDETNTEWHQVLLDAAEKNITFTTN